MEFFLNAERGTAGDKSGDIYKLGSEQSQIEVWPFLGFNCLRWRVAGQEVLYRAADWETNPVPTRSGHPILFPFPNRLRQGKMQFEGHEYQLPLTESSGKHSIHGFTPKNAWRMVDSGTSEEYAWITGEFRLSQDLPQCVECWPADARIRVTYKVFADRLRVETAIDAADGKAMPFGLGFHPYFDLGGELAEWQLRFSAKSLWECVGNLPTGRKLPNAPSLKFQQWQPLGDTAFDDLFGSLATTMPMAELKNEMLTLSVTTDASFRELLMFIPPHRKAIAIEPYTCTTDAVNLEESGIKAGWRILPAGETYTSVVEYHLRMTE